MLIRQDIPSLGKNLLSIILAYFFSLLVPALLEVGHLLLLGLIIKHSNIYKSQTNHQIYYTTLINIQLYNYPMHFAQWRQHLAHFRPRSRPPIQHSTHLLLAR